MKTAIVLIIGLVCMALVSVDKTPHYKACTSTGECKMLTDHELAEFVKEHGTVTVTRIK